MNQMFSKDNCLNDFCCIPVFTDTVEDKVKEVKWLLVPALAHLLASGSWSDIQINEAGLANSRKNVFLMCG